MYNIFTYWDQEYKSAGKVYFLGVRTMHMTHAMQF